MKILITGSSGFIGSHLVKKLSVKHDIVRYDLKFRQDVLDKELLTKKLNGVDLVIHLAAFISASESWRKPMDYMRNNVLGTLSVVDCAIKSGVKKIVFFSSAAVKAKPMTPYAVSKIAGEEIIEIYSDQISSIIVRPENIYGEGQNKEYGYVIYNFIKAIKEGKPVTIYGSGLQARDFIFIDDVVSLVNNIVEKNILGGPLSLGTGHPVRIKDLALIIGGILGMPVTINYERARNEPKNSFADVDTLKKIGIDSHKFLSLQDGIKKLIDLDYT